MGKAIDLNVPKLILVLRKIGIRPPLLFINLHQYDQTQSGFQ